MLRTKKIETEKSTKLTSALNKVVFRFAHDVSKNSIRKYVSSKFNVSVVDVHTAIIPGKQKRIGRTRNMRNTGKWKKAIVTIASGQTINNDKAIENKEVAK